MMTKGSRPFSPSPVKRTTVTIRDAFLRFVATIRLQQLLVRVFRRRPSCPPPASRPIRLSAFDRHATNEIRILQPDELRRAGTPTELMTLSRAGAVARFALRRCYPPGEPRQSAPPFGAYLAVRHIPLRVGARFGIAPALAFATSPRHTCQDVTRRGRAPIALRSSTEPTTSSRHAVLRRPDATSWRATWAEACEQPPVGGAKVPCAPTPQGSGTSRDPLLAERPRTLFVIDPGA